MENLPLYISLVFGLTTALGIYFFYRAAHYTKTVLFILIGWLVMQAVISQTGFYTVTNTIPPRFLLVIVPPFLLIISLFISRKGLNFIDSLDLKWLTLFHTVRVPVELVLYWLFLHKTVPELMTFEGRNPDILTGITAPVIYFLAFHRNKVKRNVLLIWNLICLGFLVNIVTIAILSAPFFFQQLAFDQPNIAVMFFPFNWLPACIVPLALFSHLSAIRQLFSATANAQKMEKHQLAVPTT